MTECDLLAQDLLAHFADEEAPSGDDADSVGYLQPSPRHSQIAELAAEISQLRGCGVLPEVGAVKSPRLPPRLAPVALQRPPRSLPAECRDPASSLRWWSQAIEEDPNDVSSYLERAKVAFKLGQFDDAVADGRKSTELDRTFDRGYNWTGTALLKLGRFAEAHEQFVKGGTQAEWDMRELQSQWNTAQQYYQQERYGECVDVLEDLVQHTTHSAAIKRVFVEACSKVQKWVTVIRCLPEWLGQPPFQEDPYWRYMTAMAYYSAAMPRECLRLLEADPTLEEVYSECQLWRKRCQWLLGVVADAQRCLTARRIPAATALLTEAIQRCPDLPAAQQLLRAWRAQALRRRRGGVPAAIRECTVALEGNDLPWSVMPLALRASCYVQTHEVALAVEDYERLLRLQPDHPQALRELRRLQDVIPDLYSVLGVPPNASVKRLNTAYRRLLLQYHPDRQHGQTDEERRRTKVKFHELYEAFMLLSDPAKRAEYDEFRVLAAPTRLWARPQVLRWGLSLAALVGLGWLGTRCWGRLGRGLPQTPPSSSPPASTSRSFLSLHL